MNKQDFFESLIGNIKTDDLLLIQKCYWLAKSTHRNQERDTGERYFEHCRRVAINLINHNIYDPYAIGLSFIHDVVEDGFTTPGIILTLFGPKLYQWLFILSKKLPVFDEITGQVIAWAKRDLKEYFDGIANADSRVRLVKLSDRLDNLSTVNEWPTEKIQKYINETSQFLIPIARQTDQYFLNELEEIIIKLKQYLEINRKS